MRGDTRKGSFRGICCSGRKVFYFLLLKIALAGVCRERAAAARSARMGGGKGGCGCYVVIMEKGARARGAPRTGYDDMR